MAVTNVNYLLADNNKLRDYILELDTKDFNEKIITIENISQIKWCHEGIKNLQLHAYSLRMPSNELIEAKISDDFKKNLNLSS